MEEGMFLMVNEESFCLKRLIVECVLNEGVLLWLRGCMYDIGV